MSICGLGGPQGDWAAAGVEGTGARTTTADSNAAALTADFIGDFLASVGARRGSRSSGPPPEIDRTLLEARAAAPVRRCRSSAAFAHPGRGEAADEEQEPDQAGEHRQHADAAHDARFAHPQPDPVVALE